jgi:hypothetical protein
MADAAMLNVVLGKHGDDDIVWGLQATVSCSEWRCSTDPHAKKTGFHHPKKILQILNQGFGSLGD